MKKRAPIRITRKSETPIKASLTVIILLLVILGVSGTPSFAGSYDEALQKYRKGNYAEAIDILIQKPHKTAGDHNLLGWAYLHASNIEGALREFELSLSADPSLHDSYCGLGYSYFRLMQLDKATENFTKGISKDRKSIDCLVGLGLTYEKLHNYDRSAFIFREVLLMDKDNQIAKEKLAIPPPHDLGNQGKGATSFFAKGDYFWIKQDENKPRPLLVKGVNMSFALPGRFPSEFPEDEHIYFDWIKLVGEMNANVIRVYTILPPQFYKALLRYNAAKNRDDKIYLIQGIWAELPEDGNFMESRYLDDSRMEIRNAVDVVHGNATIPHRFGHAFGSYRHDVSDYVLGFIFGREWEPYAVAGFNGSRSENSFSGKYLRIENANPMEAWLTEHLDYLIEFETTHYSVQRPVAFMNWPTLDPLYHETESSYQEETALRQKLGEIVPPIDHKVYDDDASSLDETKIVSLVDFRAGLFVSHHVYPYYPDFLRNEKSYAKKTIPDGPSYYFNYLTELKNHYGDIPLLISEFGVPTSRGIAIYHPEDMHHGGHSELRQAEILGQLFSSITKAGCAGGIVFSWIDEWVKTNWMVRGNEEKDQMWFNAMDPEESYGLMALTPTGTGKLLGNPVAWKNATLLYAKATAEPLHPLNDGFDAARNIRSIYADSDAGYLYLKVDISGEIHWGEVAYLIGIDTFGDGEGDHRLPFGIGVESPIGIEYTVLLHGSNSKILIDDKYNRNVYNPDLLRLSGLSGYEENREFRLMPNNDGLFTDIVTIRRRRFARTGEIFPEKIYNASVLKEGNLTGDSLADFFYSKEQNFIELRIPWNLLNFSDPAHKKIIVSKDQRKATKGVRVFVASYKPEGIDNPHASAIDSRMGLTDLIPSNLADMEFYVWDTWEAPPYDTHLKKSYFTLQNVYRNTQSPEFTISVPEHFNFPYVVKNHYASMDDFVRLYRSGDKSPGRDAYGTALAYLTKGLIFEEPLHLLEAKSLFALSLRTAGSTREKELSEYALHYIDRIFSGNYRSVPERNVLPEKITIEKTQPVTSNFSKIVIGKSAIILRDGLRIKTQVDRVTRDWLTAYNYETPPWFFDKKQVIPWHEGEKIREIMSDLSVRVTPVWGTRVKRFGANWYAPDADGVYRFALSEDKVYNYPTNIVLDESSVIINDTHGINAIAWDSADADLVIGCGDHEGKVEAAYYLAVKGIDVYMPTDRFVNLLMGTRTKGTIIGSAPVRKEGKELIIGNQPVMIEISEPIVVSNTTGVYPLQYYDTPFRYFKELEKFIGRPMNITDVIISGNGKASEVVDEARARGAKVIGVRVWTQEEHDAVSGWLSEQRDHRAILFHSAVYPEGYRLFFEHPHQTTFGDINIAFEK